MLCLTATAKPEVVADMLGHFRDKVGIELTVFDGGASRDNLEFSVVPTTPAEKFAHVHQLSRGGSSGRLRQAVRSCIAPRASRPKKSPHSCSEKGV